MSADDGAPTRDGSKTLDERIDEYAQLPWQVYEQMRVELAKKIGCRVPELDKRVEARRRKTNGATQPVKQLFEDVEPWGGDAVDSGSVPLIAWYVRGIQEWAHRDSNLGLPPCVEGARDSRIPSLSPIVRAPSRT